MKSLLCVVIFTSLAWCLEGFINPRVWKRSAQIVKANCIQLNKASYYNMHALVSNQTKDVCNIYTTYDNKYTLVFYKNGSYSEHLNKTLRLNYSPDVLNIHIVSNIYFNKLYNALKSKNI